jgi:hypothetical protein
MQDVLAKLFSKAMSGFFPKPLVLQNLHYCQDGRDSKYAVADW